MNSCEIYNQFLVWSMHEAHTQLSVILSLGETFSLLLWLHLLSCLGPWLPNLLFPVSFATSFLRSQVLNLAVSLHPPTTCSPLH